MKTNARTLPTAKPLDVAHDSATAENLAWAERELLRMETEETDDRLKRIWGKAARIARDRFVVKSQS